MIDPATGIAAGSAAISAGKALYDWITAAKDRNQMRNNPQQNQTIPTSQQEPGNLWNGRPATVDRYARFNPGQEQLQQQLLDLLGTHLGENVSGQSPMDQLALRQFREQILPAINENYEGGAYEQQSRAAAERLALGLSGQRQQFLQNALGTAFEPSFGAVFNQRQPGLKENLLSNPETYSNLLGAGKELGTKALDWYKQRQANKPQAQAQAPMTGKTSVGANDFQIPANLTSNRGAAQGWSQMVQQGLNR